MRIALATENEKNANATEVTWRDEVSSSNWLKPEGKNRLREAIKLAASPTGEGPTKCPKCLGTDRTSRNGFGGDDGRNGVQARNR